jgi:SsrA-binding protein
MEGMGKEKGRSVVAQNRKARHDYHLHDIYEAGLVLSGTEVKSLREGRANLTDAYATVDDGEVWLRNAHIPEYSHGTWTNHTARRTRKLLLNRQEISRIERDLGAAGTTLVPLSLYFSDGYAKVEIAVASGKRDYDKRQAIAEREGKREAARALSARLRR